MKQLSIIFLCILLPILGFSQKGVYFRVMGGASIPLQDLSSTVWTTDDKAGGFANIGYHGSVDLSWYFTPNFGVAVSGMRSYYNVNKDKIHAKAFEPGIDSIVYVDASPWVFGFMMFGPVYNVFLSEKLVMESRVQIGQVHTNSPKIELRVLDVNADLKTYTRNFSYAEGLQYNAAIGLKYMLEEELWLSFLIDYHFTQLEFTYRETIKVPNNLGALNASIGLSYKF
ncbi:MAG: hypothetical protein HOG05_14160 [Bacteroidetes bacterium]|jgi:hypothetical protein|nr:hypothetical protein [Bacteroidota bacterium]MBT3802290.1 hypothetical protein [Bacteroidota bacterium]MBT4969276.1 hypothetical protein [Bacteroidota bacterium]